MKPWILIPSCLLALFYSQVSAETNDQLSTLNRQIGFLSNKSGQGLSLTKEISEEINKISSTCLHSDRKEDFTNLINEQFRSGNPAGAILLLTQRFRISQEAANLEHKFNEQCQERVCRQGIINDLKNQVPNPKVYQILFEAQFYPRVLHIENIPGSNIKPVQGTPPKRLKWMPDHYYEELLDQWKRDNPVISSDYSVGTNHRWRESNSERTFPIAITNGYQNHGYLSQNGSPYAEYSFCDDEPIKSYSPNLWIFRNNVLVGMKTYLGCHGAHSFFFSGALHLNCMPNAKVCNPNGKLPHKFKLSKSESSCFQRRLFNPTPNGRNNSYPNPRRGSGIPPSMRR